MAYLAPAIAFYLLLLLPPLLLGLAYLAGIFFPNEINSEEISSFVAERFAEDLRDPILRFSESVFSGRVLFLSVPIMIWTLSAILSLLERGMSPMPSGGWRLVFGRIRLLLLAAGIFLLLLLGLLLPLPGMVLLVLLPVLLSAIYHFLPPKGWRPSWRASFIGALPAAFLLFLAPQLFALYISFSSFSPASSLATLVLFLLFAYLLAFALILGAGIASEGALKKESPSVHDEQ